jgi:hypothetical protein
MNVPQAWEVHDTRGEGVDVAVIDTGIDTTGHEGLAASLERGGWAEFDENGNLLDTEPNEGSDVLRGHGTAVSGVIAGGTDDEGDSYGIAPGVNLYVATSVSKPPEGVRLLSVVAGIEWAIEQEVDVLSMSLGHPQYSHAFVEPVQNAIESGILVVGSTGNAGRYTGVSPSNIPGVLAAGGINDDRQPYDDGSGEQVDTERYWGDDAPDSWPQTYTVPDVTAPAVDVPSAYLDGEYTADRSGTSYAAPCVAGVAALALAATDADSEAVRNAIIETACHPATENEFDLDPGHDDRYGQGIVSALATISHLRASETVSGTVTDESGTPLDGVTVVSEAGLQTETDDQGTYELTLPPVTQPVGATGLGFDTTGGRIDPASTDTQSFELARTDGPEVEMTGRMATRIDPGNAATATFDTANVEAVTVVPEVNGPADPEALELTVNDTAVAFGEPVAIDPDRTQVTVGIAVPESALIAQFRASYEFTGGEESVEGRGHLVYAHPDPFVISPSDPPSLQTPIDLMAPRTTLELTDGQAAAVASGDDDAGVVIDKPLTVRATDGATPEIQFSNEGADEPAAVLVLANDVTISGLDVDGSGAETGVQVGLGIRETFRDGKPWPSGVTVRDLSVAGATTAIRSYQSPALRITNNELTADATGITVAGRAKVTVRANDVTDVETGIEAVGQVDAIEANSLSDIGGTGISVGTPRFLSRHWGQEIGPVRSNTVTGATRGIAIEGVTTRPVEENDLSDIGETALVVNGGILAPLRSNSIENAQRGITIADDADVATVSDNEFTNVEEPGDGVEADDAPGDDQSDTTPEPTETPDQRNTDEPTPEPTVSPTETEAGPAATETAEADGSGSGFGIGSAVAGLGTVGYLLKRRWADDETE